MRTIFTRLVRTGRSKARRGLLAAGFTAVVLGALLTAASPARADGPVGANVCSPGAYIWHGTSFNVCILIDGYSDGDWNVRIGLDLAPAGFAQSAILNCPANFSAELWGSDESSAKPGLQSVRPSGEDDFRTYLPITAGWPRVGPAALGVEFDKRVNWRVLNEDDGTDEVYALITFDDCSSDSRPVRIRTDEIVHNF